MLKKEQKEELAKDLALKLGRQSFAFYNFDKVTSQEMVDLRRQARAEKIETSVIKRRLIEKTLDQVKIKKELPQGSFLIATSVEDEVAPFRFIAQIIKKIEKGNFQGGIFEKKFIDENQAQEISILPSKDELSSKLVCLLKSPLQSLHYNLSYNLMGLTTILSKKAEAQS